MTVIERFQDRRRLLEALAMQKLVNGDAELIEAMAAAIELRQYAHGDALIAQGAIDDHVCLIFAGGVDIIVNGRPIAKRSAGEHVGEMALLSPDSRRSATVVANEMTVVGSITEAAFSEIAKKWPVLWRRIASNLAERLKQRSQYVRQRNETPIMFIGSSKEGLEVARAIQSGLAYDNVIVRVWTDKVFGSSNFPMDDLARQVSETDFGVLVVTPDDRIISRGDEQDAPRDNVIFELGMLIGSIDRSRTYFVVPRGQEVRIPSDLFGMNPMDYVPGDGRDLAARIAPICNSLRDKLRDLGPR